MIEEVIPTSDQIQEDSMVKATRRSTRGVHPHVSMKDFVSLNINKDVQYPIPNYVAYDNLSTVYKVLIAASSELTKPTTYNEAIKDPR